MIGVHISPQIPPPESPSAVKRPPLPPVMGGTPSRDSNDRQGLFGWLRFQGSSTPSTAFLGEKNRYKYNPHSQTWDLTQEEEQAQEKPQRVLLRDVDDNSDTYYEYAEEAGDGEDDGRRYSSLTTDDGLRGGGTRRKMNKEELEEHGLVLAIQAAHLASSFNNNNNQQEGGGSSNIFNHSYNKQYFHYNSKLDMDMGSSSNHIDGIHHDNNNHSSDPRNKIISSQIFLLVTSIYLFTSLLQSFLLTLIPVWLVSSESNGGLSCGVQDVAMVLSGAAIFCLNLHLFFHNKLSHILKASPVRTLRIGGGVLSVLLFATPIIAYKFVALNGIDGLEGGGGPAGSIDFNILSLSIMATSNKSLVSLQIIACLISLIVSAIYVCRKATGVLLQLALASSFSSPAVVRQAINGFSDVIGPSIATILYSSIYNMKLKYPMDSTFFMSFSVCVILMVYLGSIFLTVQFVGDYGIMPDYKVDHDESSNRFNRSSQTNNTNNADKSICSSCSNICEIPYEDFNLLWSKVGSGYGSKLYNLKNADFKDL